MRKILFVVTLLLVSLLFVSCMPKNEEPAFKDSFSPANGTKGLEGEVTISWEGMDIDQDDSVKYNLFLGNDPTNLPKVLSETTDTSYSVSTELNERYYWQVEVTDGESSVKSDIFEFWTKGLMDLYVTDYKSGGAVENATVKVFNDEEEIGSYSTDSSGFLNINNPNLSERVTLEILKYGHAKTKIVNLKLDSNSIMDFYATLQLAEFNADPESTNYPIVDIEIWNEDLTTEFQEGDTISGTTVVKVNSSTDYFVTSVIYASFDKIPGSSFMTGNRGYVSNSDELLWPADTYHYVGETPLYIAVYDQNNTQILITKYFNIDSPSTTVEEKKAPFDYTSLDMGTNIDSYSRSNSKLGFYSDDSPILKNRENKIKILNNKFDISLNNELRAAPDNGNLWNEVWYIPLSILGNLETMQPLSDELLPNGYNIYRSFDNENWEKVIYEAEPASGIVRDYSPKLEPGKEVHYQVTSVYSDGESAPTYLGSVTPLPGFRVELTSPSMNATNVSRTPDFQWKPIMDEDVAVTDNADFTYYAFIYDMVHTSQYIYPVYEEEGALYIDYVTISGSTPVTMTWEDYDWLLNGIGYINNLEANKAYSWAIDMAIAEVSDSDSYAISIAIDEGWGIDPFGGVDASVFNTFITGSEL